MRYIIHKGSKKATGCISTEMWEGSHRLIGYMTKKQLLSAVAALSIGAVSIGSVALANENNSNKNKKNDEVKSSIVVPNGSNPEITIGSQGKVYLHGAKVTAVSGSVVTATVSPVGLSMTFTLNTTGNTSLIKRAGGKATVADIKVGDYLAVRGTLVANSATPTITVTSIRDYSLENNPILQKTVFDGKLVSIAGTVAPTTLVATFNGKTYTVVVPSGISIVNANYQSVSLSTYKVGDNIRVYGAIRAGDMTTIDASILRNVTNK